RPTECKKTAVGLLALIADGSRERSILSLFRISWLWDEVGAGGDEFVGIKRLRGERRGHAAILLEHLDRFLPILFRHPAERLSFGVRRDPALPLHFRLASRDGWLDRRRVLPGDGDHLVEILAPVQKSFEGGSDETPD